MTDACTWNPQILFAQQGNFRLSPVTCEKDMHRALALRSSCFRDDPSHNDREAIDEHCVHCIVTDMREDRVVATFRLIVFDTGGDIDRSFAASVYDLSRLAGYPGRLLELGRFCTAPDVNAPDVLRLAMAALTNLVDHLDIKMMFGSSSFKGTRPRAYREVFSFLNARHRAPEAWKPLPKAEHTFSFDDLTGDYAQSTKAPANIPPLLKTYMMMGAWVSDHCVIDHDLNTVHIFTCVSVDDVPAGRAAALRAMANAVRLETPGEGPYPPSNPPKRSETAERTLDEPLSRV